MKIFAERAASLTISIATDDYDGPIKDHQNQNYQCDCDSVDVDEQRRMRATTEH